MARAGPAGTAVDGAAIAADALTYAGNGYAWGGPASRPGNWDCSSFTSYVLGKDFALQLPGGGSYGSPGYPPNSHGPDVAAYVTWSGATTLGKQETPQAGDLVMWPPNGHIGICTGPTTMISALNTSLGTLASPIQGYGPTNTYMFRRVNGVGATPAQTGGPPGGPVSALNAQLQQALGPLAAALTLGGGIGLAVIAIGGALLLMSAGGIIIAIAGIAGRDRG